MLTTKGHCKFAQSQRGDYLVTPSGSTIMFKRDTNNLPFAIGTMNVTATLTTMTRRPLSNPYPTLFCPIVCYGRKSNTHADRTTQGPPRTPADDDSGDEWYLEKERSKYGV